MFNDLIVQSAVLGAAGKMGRGIALLLLQEMALEEKGAVILIDAVETALNDLKPYLRTHLRRFAEQNINYLRQKVGANPHLISNEEIIDDFLEKTFDRVRFETDVLQAKNSGAIFEAIVESGDIKADIFAKIDAVSSLKPYYLSNTSSIPIHELMEKSGIQERLIGFHFYNPPPVQKLMEIIEAKTTSEDLKKLAEVLAKKLNKTVVHSNDIAGFIGNGHFMREIYCACQQVKRLEKKYTRTEAIWIVNYVTEKFLIRPMGIFQLIDYVGWDICRKVLEIMRERLKEEFDMGILSEISQGVVGGQNADGTQKNGIFQYQKNEILKIWNKGIYEELPNVDFGGEPEVSLSWKILSREKNKEEILKRYFNKLFSLNTFGGVLSQKFLENSRSIARKLVSDGVAKSIEDVNTVLKLGFYHLYGADEEWVP